jgi:hypothetical protein
MRTILGYTFAGLSSLLMLIMPFVLFPAFTRLVVATGVRVDPVYSGGPLVRTIARPGYRILVGAPVRSRAPLGRTEPFLQLEWTPADSLPARVADGVDTDGDGRSDLLVAFEVPRNPNAPLFVDVTPLAADTYRPLRHVSRGSFSALVARVGERIVVRVPLAR